MLATVSDVVQAISSGVIILLTIGLVWATFQYADAAKKTVEEMRRQSELQYRLQVGSPLVRALLQAEITLARGGMGRDPALEAFREYQPIWLDIGEDLGEELEGRGTTFSLMFGELSQDPSHEKDDEGNFLLDSRKRHRVVRALVSYRQMVKRWRRMEEIGPLDQLPHPDRWGDWMDAPRSAKVSAFQGPLDPSGGQEAAETREHDD